MPLPSPFHPRTAPLCTSHRWKEWAGYLAVCAYTHSHEPEYLAFRHAAGLLDVTPLFKYEVRGKDAGALLDRMAVKQVSRLKPGRMTYCCWCDDHGKVIDDGTIARLGEDWFRVTSADPAREWMMRLARGLSVEVEDVTARLAAVALQGPTAREILKACSDAPMDRLKYFGVVKATLDGLPVWISRTGYTGDLGYEIWVDTAHALRLWDALMDAGRAYGITPAGLDALDVSRIEAGFVLSGVDYFSAHRVIQSFRKSSPYEIGLGWAVELDRAPFVGQAALRAEVNAGSPWALVGVEASWEELEALYESYNLPPSLPATASRSAIPLYAEGKQVGQVTSHVWSPMLKKLIGVASVRPAWAKPGTTLRVEHTVEYERRTVGCTVVKPPFFDPERKRSTPAAGSTTQARATGQAGEAHSHG